MANQVVLVPFEGADSGEQELTWGQADLWLAMQRMRTWLPIGAVAPVPAGTTVEDVVADLRFLASRHQSVRTRVRQPPDGRARQVVHRRGELPLEIVDTPAGEDSAKVAEQVAQRFRDHPYDFATDWPVRTAVIRDRGAPTHRVMIMCHLVADAAGAAAMMADLANRDPDTGVARVPVTGMPPLEQARWQCSPAGQRQSRAALRHWAGLLRGAIPAHRFRGPTDPCQPRYWQLRFHSPALHLAVQALAARTGVASTSVLLTLFAVSLARVTGISPAVIRVMVNNRFRPGLAEAVAPISHAGLLAVDVAGITVDEALDRLRRRAMATYKHAYYDPYRMLELVDLVGRERGEEIDLGCFFNDRRQRLPEAGAAVPTPDQIRAALPQSTFGCELQQDDPLERLFVHVDDAPEAVDLTLLTDTSYLPPADAEACVRGMEETAVAAASDPNVPTGVPPGGGVTRGRCRC